jgi:ABC-type transport system involved in multi-copper enzyme maturation permease subunit
MRKFVRVVAWELKNIARFPIVEVLLALLVFQVMSSTLVNARSISRTYFPFDEFPQGLMLSDLVRQIATDLAGAFISTSFIGVVSATMLFSYQYETGLTKFYMSLPIKRTNFFLAKLLACFLVPFLMLVAVGCTAELFLNPVSVLFLFSAPMVLARALLIIGEMVLFVIAVSISLSILSHNTAVSFISSLAILYGLTLVSGSIGVPILPPASFSQGLWSFLFYSQRDFWSTYPGWTGAGTLALTPTVALILLVVSYFYFSRRLNL